VKKIVGALIAITLIPVLIGGAATGASSSMPVTSSAVRDIPPRYLQLYVQAAARFGFSWQLLAAVGKLECDHGRGDCYRPNSVGAMGPMQFMARTWESYKASSRHAPFNVYDARDAIFAAAAKLSADGIRQRPRAALFSYNHSHTYVDAAISWAVRYGWISGGANTLAHAVLSDTAIELQPQARADVAAGVVDPRVLAALLYLALDHRLSEVGPFVTGHSLYVAGTTRVSNHAVGRAVDIPIVDDRPVSAANMAAKAAVQSLLDLPGELRPDELGAPWYFPSTTVISFTEGHHDHLHIGYSP
jgi:Transglycosylase SLT domain